MDKEVEAIIPRLDKLIEQQQLTNSLITMRGLDYKSQEKMCYYLSGRGLKTPQNVLEAFQSAKNALLFEMFTE